MKEIVVTSGQTLQDIALQEYGSVEGTPWLFVDNQLPNGWNTVLVPGTRLLVRDQVIDEAVRNKFRAEGLRINNGDQNTTEELDGISIWQIGTTFIINGD